MTVTRAPPAGVDGRPPSQSPHQRRYPGSWERSYSGAGTQAVGPERFAASSSVQRAGVRLLSNTGRLSNASERACRDHASAHLAEADAVILALRPAGQHDFIVVLEEA